VVGFFAFGPLKSPFERLVSRICPACPALSLAE
jgi:hypothetical protein